MKTPAVLHRHRCHALFGILGLGSLTWLLVRSGSKPQRLSYPCQQAALAQTVGSLGYLASLFGFAHVLTLLRRRARLSALTVLGAGLALAVATVGGQTHIAPAHAASGELPGWTSPSAISDVFVIDQVPVPECSLDGGALPTTAPCNSASYALRDRGVDRLITEMDSHGTYFYETTSHPGGIVGSDDVVVIKVNNQSGGQGSGDGYGRLITNGDVVKGVIWAIVQHPGGFTGEVVIAENTQGVNDAWNLTPANAQDQHQTYQDVVTAFRSQGYSVSLKSWDPLNDATISGGSVGGGYPTGEFVNDNNDDAYILLEDAAGSGADELSYPKFTSADGHAMSMRYGVWNGSSYDSDRLTFINIPVLKRHGMAGATIAWKNLVGFQTIADNTRRFGGWNEMHGFFWGYGGVGDTDYGLFGRELARVRAPDLNIVDAIWVATDDNTGGNAVRENVLAASTDPFAVDWYASEYILRNAVGNDDLMGGVSAARGGTFRSATRVNQNVAQAVWPGGAYPYIDLLDGYDGDTASATEQQEMNVFVTAMSTPALSISDVTVVEGASGPVAADLTVTASPTPTSQVTVAFTAAGGTASAGNDYESTSGTLTFDAGSATQTISLPVFGDALDEPDETVIVTLSAPAGATLEDAQGVVTITDDDPPPSLYVDDVSVTEGDAGTVGAVFKLHLSEASGQRVTAAWASANGSALAPADYTAGAGTVTFAPGETTKTATVAVRGDALDEDDETFALNIGTVSNASVSDGQATATILDDDGLPTLSVADVTIAEGNTGTRNAVFTARLSKTSGREVRVDWQTSDGTALAGADYTAANGTLTFPAGIVTRTFAVPVLGDTADEPNEALRVLLSGEVNATLQRSEATVTITDDDPLPGLRVANLAVSEGHSDTAEALVTVTLSAASSRDVTVNWATANGTARAPSDYASTSGTLNFPAGETTRTLSVPVRGDVFVEPDETVKVLLSGAVNAALATPTGLITIRNDDAAVQLAVAAGSKAEGGVATVTVTRTGALPTTVTTDYATADGTATAGEDYLAASGTLTFGPGVTSRAFTVTTLTDAVGEGDETVNLTLSNPSAGATLDVRPAAVLTILDDDVRVRLLAASYRVTEGGLATITVQRAGSTAAGLTVDYTTSLIDGGATSDDFTPRSGTLTFAQGQLARSFTVPTAPDTLDESDEALRVELTSADLGGTPVPLVSPASADLTIVDNDSGGVLQFAAASYSSHEGGSATITVTRTGGLASAVTVDYQTFDGTATQGADYNWAGGTLSFGAGQTQRAFTVGTLADEAGEGSETFTLELFNLTGGAVLGARAAVPFTISDADAFVQLAAANYAVTEGGTLAVAFRRVNSIAAGESVSYQVVSETADGADYSVAATGTLIFAAGQVARTLPIVALQDTLVETPETLRVEITGASIGVGQPTAVTVTIRDDDHYPAGEMVFITEGASFAPVLTLKAAATVLWTWNDDTTSADVAPSKDYGAEGRRVNRLRVTPWSAVRRINIGYDEGDGGSPEIEHVADQHVREVYGLNLVAPYLEHWCSSYNDLEALSFDSFVVLDTIECYYSNSLRKVSLRNTPRLHRACFEDCDLEALDLSGSPALEDLRGAQNAYPGITFAARHNSTWHVCIRDNPQFTNRAMFSNASRFPGIAELFIWNTNQAGALNVHSTSTTRWVAILAAGNSYTSADFSGALQNPANSSQIDLSNNQLTSVTVAGCTQLSTLSLANNPLGSATIDRVLYELDELGTSGGSADLTGTSQPSAAGLAHRANLLARSWTVQVDGL